MAKSQHPPPLAQRVADELELVQRVAKSRATWVQNFHNKFWSAVEEADPLIKIFVREQMDAFLLAVASGHPMRHDTPRQPKTASPLPKPSQNLPPRPPAASTTGLKAIFRLSEDAPLLRADATSVKAAFIRIVPGLKDGIVSVSRSSNGFIISFSSDTSRKLALDNADSIKASLSGSLFQIEDRIGYVVKRIPRTIWNPVSNVVPTTIDDVKSIAQAQTGVTPSGARWLLHEDCHDPLHTAVIFFPKEVPTFRIVDSAPSRRYIPNPKVVQCDACFGFHPSSRCRTQALCSLCGALRHRGECCHQRRCINCLGPHSADDHKCPLRPRPFKGKLINPSEKTIAELRSRNRINLRKERRAEAAAAAATATATATSDAGSGAPNPSTEASSSSQCAPASTQNRFTVYFRSTPPPRLRFLQANVGRGGSSHLILLQAAFQGKYDVIFVQEPWTKTINLKNVTKSHPAYVTFTLPNRDWKNARPRVMTYVRKKSNLRPVQLDSGHSPDINALRLQSSPLIEIINVYRQPQAHMPESLCTLLNWPVKPNTIIVGDFNLHHELWEPNVSRSSGVSTLIEWIDVHSLRSAVPYGAPTHRAGHVLDLVLTNMEGLSARVAPEAYSTSDHETIAGFVQLSPSQRRHPPLKLPNFNSENAEVFRQALSATSPPSFPLEDPSPQLLDTVTTSGIATLSAILLSANPPRPACVPCKDYWNHECSDYRRQYLESRHSGDQDLISVAHNNFRKAVRRAKREHMRAKLDHVSSIMEAHKVVGWRKLASRFGPPPIIFQGVTYSTPTERADIFFRTKLARVTSQPDVPLNTPTCSLRAIPAPLSVMIIYRSQLSASFGGWIHGARGLFTSTVSLWLMVTIPVSSAAPKW
ncbi:hypothetical protein K3495_g11357 [Podosphaera aphanis]|nr:hypothetical protein K3495_g11357 [Podosphaera aphanis]